MLSAPPVELSSKQNSVFKNKKDFKLKFDNLIYNLFLSYNEDIISFEIQIENDFPKKDFKLLLNLEELIKLNKYFAQFDSVSEIPSSFETLIEMKKISILKEEKEIKLKIINPINKKEFYISIPLKEKSLKSELDSIIPYIVSLNDKINNIEKRMNLMEKKLN